jgi:tetratricopeptide (TPR) repeat protein
MNEDFFVGRKALLIKCANYLQELNSSETGDSFRVLTLQGAGGIGKTKLLEKLQEQVSQNKQFITTGLIDMQAMSNRSAISFLQTIAYSLNLASKEKNEQFFLSFFESVRNYNTAKAQEKNSLYEPLIQSFLNSCLELSKETPILIVLDTFESVQAIKMGKWILDLLPRFTGTIGVIIAGRQDIQISGVKFLRLEVGKFSSKEIDELGKKIFDARGIGTDYDLTQSVIKSLEHLTDGRPILAILAIEWIIERVDPEAIISIKKELFESEIIQYLHILDKENFEIHLAIVIMATINKRFNANFLGSITDWETDKCLKICTELAKYSFVKVISNENVLEQTITLHDEMLRLVNSYITTYPESIKNKWRQKVVEKFYNREIGIVVNPQVRQTLIAEKLNYQLRYAPIEGVQFFDLQISNAIDGYEFEFCDLLLSEANDSNLNLNKKQLDIIELNNAEMLIKNYQPFDAKAILDRLILSFNAEQDTEYLSRVTEGLGACIANGATVIETNITEALDMWKESLKICKKKKLDERVAIILYNLGYGHDLLGQHEEALFFYGESCQMARALGKQKLLTTTLDDMGRLKRKRYEVPESLELFQESLAIKEEVNDTKSMGTSYHYMGDAYRDLDNFPEALKWYERAEKARKKVSDSYGLCVLYGDIGWLYLLKKDWSNATKYTNKSYFDYAIPFHFGREMAEMEHSYYHIELEVNGLDSALPWIEKSFVNAERYSNTFIYLDAAMHLIEAAYERQEYDKIPHYYKKMDELDQKGCGYRMFKGRSANILGDIAYDRQNYSDALDYWLEGFTIIAIHGRSRSSVLSFDEHLQNRLSSIIDAFARAGFEKVQQFRSHWSNTILDEGKPETLADEYPIFIDLCNNVIGDE